MVWIYAGEEKSLPFEEKLPVTAHMMLSLTYVEENDKAELKEGVTLAPVTKDNTDTIILPLSNFDVVEHDNRYELHLFTSGKNVVLRDDLAIEQGALSLTDDPRIEWASDWSDLGCFRLVYKFVQPQVKRFKTKVKFIVPKKEGVNLFEQHMTLPDKKKWF